MVGYAIIALIFLFTVKSIFRSIRERNTSALVCCLLLLPIQFFFFVSLLLGGSALQTAGYGYEGHLEGHYYLVSHGQWTEVSHGQYLLVLGVEIAGIFTTVLAVVLSALRALRGKTNP